MSKSKKHKKKSEADREYKRFVLGWLSKTVERATLILLSIKDKTDIREEDWDVLKFFWRGYYEGYLPNFVPEFQPPQGQVAKTTEQMLFSTDNVTQETIGAKIAQVEILTLKEEKDE